MHSIQLGVYNFTANFESAITIDIVLELIYCLKTCRYFDLILLCK